MILYRIDKDYKKELKLINSGIKELKNSTGQRNPDQKKIAEISNKLNRSFGFTDKKARLTGKVGQGNAVYDPEPISGWKKRKATLEKRIK